MRSIRRWKWTWIKNSPSFWYCRAAAAVIPLSTLCCEQSCDLVGSDPRNCSGTNPVGGKGNPAAAAAAASCGSIGKGGGKKGLNNAPGGLNGKRLSRDPRDWHVQQLLPLIGVMVGVPGVWLVMPGVQMGELVPGRATAFEDPAWSQHCADHGGVIGIAWVWILSPHSLQPPASKGEAVLDKK